MVSDMQPISDFGLFVAIGLMLSFFFTAAIVPGVLSWLRAGAIAVPQRPTHWTAPLGRAVASRRVWFLASSVVVLVVSLLLMTDLRVESNLLEFFPRDSKVHRDYEFIGERLTGLHTLEFDAVTDAQNGSALLKQIEQLGADLAARPEVAQVIHYKSIATSLDPIHQSVFVETARASQNPLKLLARKYRHTEDGRVSLRMSILVRAMASSDFSSLLDFAQQQAARRIEPPATYTLTGVVPLLNATLDSLITTQVRSFAAAAITVLVLVGVFFRSWKVFLVASLPNLLPTAILFATMAVFNLPLDSATVMIAGIGIGIAVDDTFHFFSCYRAARLAGQDSPTAIHSSFRTTGRGILFTSIVATAGFGILLLAEFKPIQYFGLLAGVTMLTASAADFLVLPACVAFMNLWGRSKENRVRQVA